MNKEEQIKINLLKEDIKIKKAEIKKEGKIDKEKVKALKAYKKEESLLRNNPPHLRLIEEIGNAITHGAGSIFAVVAIILMIIKSTSTKQIVAALIYGICMLLLFTMSCLYHSFKYGSKVKRIFRRFDYSTIYLLIGGTFTPILLIFLNNLTGVLIAIIQWIIIITGITFIGIFGPGKLKWFHFPAYFILGWLGGIFIVPRMFQENINLFFWILSGGLFYTLGMVPFLMGEKKHAHFIWHFFVIFGAVIQWIGIYIYLY